MDFIESIKQFSERVSMLKDTISTEEATKMSLVVPLFQLLGYDVFNPSEFCPEYIADVGIKKGEKVDYAILENGQPTILIECKSCSEQLDKHSSQLFRYFGTSPAKFGILTNGIIYRFYTDLEESNKMDLVPFLEINMLQLKDASINELKKFCKDNFDKDKIFSTAEELKYSSLIKGALQKEFESPSDDFVRFILADIYEGQKNQRVLDKFSPLVKRAFSSFVNEIVNTKISSALSVDSDEETNESTATTVEEAPVSKIITTEEEIEGFYIVRGLLAGIVPVEDVVYRDTESYFGVLYTNNNRKPICRLNLDTKNKQLLIPDENKKFERIYIESLNDIYKYKNKLIEVVKRIFIKKKSPPRWLRVARISEDILYLIVQVILYHLRTAIASGTSVPCWLLFLYPFLCDAAPERRCVLWEDERNTLNYRTATALLSAYPGRIGQTLMEFTLRPKNSI